MSWLTGGKQGEVKKRVADLADPSKRKQAALDLVALDTDSIPILVEALQTKDVDLLAIYQQILSRIPSALPTLLKLISEAHPIIRARVVDVLSLRKDRSTVPVLLEALQGEYYTVRARAAIALGHVRDKSTIEFLFKALRDPEVDVRIGACLGLGAFNDPSTFDEIANVLLDDQKIEARQAAARALGETRNPDAIPYLMEALRDSYWWYERETAAGDLLEAIEKMGSHVVDPLIEALKDKEGAVRKFAANLLGRLKDQRALDPLGMALYDLHHDVGKIAAEALVNFGGASFEILVEALDHSEMWIRVHSIDVLTKFTDERVALILLEMLNDPEREVQRHVIEAMGNLRDERTRPALQKIASDRSDREFHAMAKAILEQL